LPDEGYIICDVDLSQADARVIAYDANATRLKEIFKDPSRNLHKENADAIFGPEAHKDEHKYFLAKKGVHSVHYVITPTSLSRHLDITKSEAKFFIDSYLSANPAIQNWHDDILYKLQSTGIVYNAFGYRRVFFDRPESVLTNAAGWIGQSTVAILINRIEAKMKATLSHLGYELLKQVHDSLVYQIPILNFAKHLPIAYENFHSIPIPYEDPLIIPAEMKASSISWGDVQKIRWDATSAKGSRSPTAS
jgi:DNA polymerase-1